MILDEEKFVRVRSKIVFYYYGKKCLADYDMKTIALLDKLDIDIILLATGKNTIKEVKKQLLINEKISDKVDGMTIITRIYRLLNKGILIIRKKKSDVRVKIEGEYGKYYPKELVIELTNICNFRCPFCYKDALVGGKYIDEILIDSLNNIIKGKISNILLTGGEPTLHPSFLKYLEMFSDYAKVRMVSNGSQFYRYDSEALKRLSMVQFSLYGSDDVEYEKVTGEARGFYKLEKSIEVAKKRDIPFSIATTLNINTLMRAEEYIQTAIMLGAKRVNIGTADMFGRELNAHQNRTSENIDIEKFMLQLLEYKKKYQKKINVVVNNIDMVASSDKELNEKVYNRCLKCGSGIDSLVLSQDGYFRPCPELPESVFNLGGLDYLIDFINGNFRGDQLYQCIKKFCNEKDMIPCGALQEYYEKNICR